MDESEAAEAKRRYEEYQRKKRPYKEILREAARNALHEQYPEMSEKQIDDLMKK